VSLSNPFDDPVPRTVAVSLDEAFRVLQGRLGLDEGGGAVTENEVLLPAEAARRQCVATRVIVQAMYEKRLPRVKLEDGTLGIPADALDSFRVQSA